MLKISATEPVNHAVTLRLEGRVMGAWVAELRAACEKVLATGQPLQLHLSEVEFLDVGGILLLSSLRAQGVALLHCSPFVAKQLKLA